MDNVSIGVTPIIENIILNAGVNNQVIDITLVETAEVVQLDIAPNLIEVNIIRSEGEVAILQFASYSNFPATGKVNYFYLAKDTNRLYRWNGSTYAEISALGFTAENAANKGIANGYASLDSGGKVPSSQLPSYVDDVIEVANYAALPVTGETGKIYITLNTNAIYRWSGSVYVEISTDKAVWGGITGTLSNQTDLVSALAAKQNNLSGTGFVKSTAGTISYDTNTYLTTANAGNTYVPYTGAISDVNLGSNDITAASFVKSGGTSSQFLKADGSVDSITYADDSNVVHKTGNESIAGFKTFTGYAQFENGVYIKQDGTLSGITGYNTFDANTTSVIFSLPNTSSAAEFKLSNLTERRFFDLPNASGTIALTSDIPSLTGYVPTTRTLTIDGTTQDLSANRSFAINYPITSFNTRTGAITLSSTDVTTALGFTPYNATNPANYIDASALAPYLLLAGGTMTGALSGTSASYSGNVTALSFIKTGGTSAQFLKADGTVDSSVYALESRLISTSGPLSGGGSLAADRTISISKADTSTDGYLSSTDWDTFNDKQAALNGGTGFVKSTAGVISYDTSSYYLASNPSGYTNNTGTVTSVALTVPSAFSVSGSPITSSGTLAITATGDTTQYIAGDGSLVTFPSMSTASTLIREVRNTTGATLTKGTIVYISGATGNKPTVSKAIATGDSTSAQTFGMVQADIAHNANGNVVCIGDITGLNTSALTEGDQLYLSSTTAGTYTTTKQYAPAHLVYIGIVTRSHATQGQIEVKIQNGYELDELHNVSAQTPSNNDALFYESSTSLWKNKSIATVLGYTPANGASYLPLTGGTLSGTLTMDGSGGTANPIQLIYNTSVNRLLTPVLRLYGNTSIASNYVELFGTNATSNRIVNFPDASGTVALTSDLSSYLPLSGGTLTGKLTISASTMGAQINGGTFTAGDSSTYALGVANGGGYDLTFGTSSTYANINTWSAKPLILQAHGTNNVGIGLTNPQTQLHINGVMSFTEPGYDTVRLHKIDHSHSSGSDTNNFLRFFVSDGSGTTDERVRLNGLGNVLIGTTADSKAKLRVAGNIRMGSVAVSGLVRSFYAVQIGNNIAFDVFRWLDDSGSVIGTGAIAGSLYLTFSDTATGGNQIQYEYRILSNGNGTSDATLTQVGYQLRGTQPITSVQLVNDGSVGGIKVRGTVVSSGVSGCSVWGTFIGNANG